MSRVLKKKHKTILRIIFHCTGVIILVISYLCFINMMQNSLFTICGSACEYWWSWIVNLPPQGICIALCVPRNWLYKPLFLIGCCWIIFGILIEIINIKLSFFDHA